eukprot:CFRG4492T1
MAVCGPCGAGYLSAKLYFKIVKEIVNCKTKTLVDFLPALISSSARTQLQQWLLHITLQLTKIEKHHEGGMPSHHHEGGMPEMVHSGEEPLSTLEAMVDDLVKDNDHAGVAKAVLTYSEWATVSTVTTTKNNITHPFGQAIAMGYAPTSETEGLPCMYMTSMDTSMQHMNKNSLVSLTYTLAQTRFCSSHGYDVEDPRCVHVTVVGRSRVTSRESEPVLTEAAQTSLFTVHPAMKDWPEGHGFEFVVVDIDYIWILDGFGGAKIITSSDFNAAKLPHQR